MALNTAMPSNRAKNWCITINNYKEEQYELAYEDYTFKKGSSKSAKVWGSDVSYYVLGKERGERGTEHLQGYVQFKRPVAIGHLKNVFGDDGHYEIQRSKSNKSAADYCKKDGTFRESGVFTGSSNDSRSDKGTKGIKKKIYQELKAGTDFKSMLDTYPEHVRYMSELQSFMPGRKNKEARIIYIWGDTSMGKTTNVIRALEYKGIPFYVKGSGNKWWDGYVGQPVAILNEFQSCFSLSSFLQLTDPYPPMLEVKGGHTPNHILLYIITTNHSPREQYPEVRDKNSDKWDAYYRRVNTDQLLITDTYCKETRGNSDEYVNPENTSERWEFIYQYIISRCNSYLQDYLQRMEKLQTMEKQLELLQAEVKKIAEQSDVDQKRIRELEGELQPVYKPLRLSSSQEEEDRAWVREQNRKHGFTDTDQTPPKSPADKENDSGWGNESYTSDEDTPQPPRLKRTKRINPYVEQEVIMEGEASEDEDDEEDEFESDEEAGYLSDTSARIQFQRLLQEQQQQQVRLNAIAQRELDYQKKTHMSRHPNLLEQALDKKLLEKWKKDLKAEGKLLD